MIRYMDNKIAFSYLIVTRNKLPYLKAALGRLSGVKKPDEEIIIADGNSSDGTKEYLQAQKNSGLVDDFISEPDFGIAHALNKLMLKARGELFMLIADDDVYDFSVLNKCKAFMREHPEADLICTNGGVLYASPAFKKEASGYTMRALDYSADYLEWQKTHKPFAFAELGLMLRRSSLALTGLRDLRIQRADAEFSLRLTAGKSNIAWYTGYAYVNILNDQSTSRVFAGKMKKEMDLLNKFYLNKNPDHLIVSKFKALKNKVRGMLAPKKNRLLVGADQSWPSLVKAAENWLARINSENRGQFIYNR